MENSLFLREPTIIFLGLLIMAGAEKLECDNCKMIAFFPLADWKMLWPVYVRELCFHIVIISWAYVLHRIVRTQWSLVAFLLVFGWGLNFGLRNNLMWFRVYGYPFGYTAFAALIFMLCLTIQMTNGLSRSRY